MVVRGLMVVLAGMTLLALRDVAASAAGLGQALSQTLANFGIILLHPAGGNHLGFAKALYEVVVTLGLAFLTTLIGAVVALVLGLFSARNLAPGAACTAIKIGVTVVRAVPTILWVLIFAVAAGLGSTAAVIGMSFHSVSYLTKAYAESFEDLDRGVIEALRASGASWWQVVFQAVIPTCSTALLSWTFLRFEINFANAVAMGAAAGAAGIGFDLYMASSFYFDLNSVGLMTYLILAFALVLEVVATGLKARIRDKT